MTLLTCSWRFFKSATALGKSVSSTSYKKKSKEKPLFLKNYEKTGRLRWNSPQSPSDTPDFRPFPCRWTSSQSLKLLKRSSNSSPVSLLLLLPRWAKKIAPLKLLSSPLFPRANNLLRATEVKGNVHDGKPRKNPHTLTGAAIFTKPAPSGALLPG